ncbi:hypothetical protein GGR51DRAFT_406469 [Nemania sp. FL0031]|nr:hypothetical protein GGR51DRAFT_406469 [Nemania sp. FL0031]
MSEKIRRQDAVIKASITSRDKRAHRRGEILRPEQNGPRNWHDRFRNPFTDTLAASGMTGGRHDTSKGASLTTRKCTRDDIPVGLLSPKTSHCQVVTSGIRDVSASDIPVQTDETATMKVAPQHDQGNPGTSLEPMIYPDPLLDNPTDRRGNLRQPYDEQTPSHPAYRNCEGEKCQRYAGNTDSMSNKKGTELTENNSPVTHRALDDSSMVSGMIVRACRDSDRERQATITSSPSQSIHGRNSPTTISTTTQESPQIGKARANARVAATLALANVQGSTSQKI